MAAMLAAGSYSRIGFSSCLAVRVRCAKGSRWNFVPPGTRNNTPFLEPFWDLMSLMMSGFPENCILFDS